MWYERRCEDSQLDYKAAGPLRRRCVRTGSSNSRLVIVNSRRLGATDAQILDDYPALTAADVHAAWKYYESNKEEIDLAIRENEAGEEGLVE